MPSPHLQNMAPPTGTSYFLWTQGNDRGTLWRRNLRWLYTVTVPGYNIFFCVSNAGLNDKSQIQTSVMWGYVTTKTGRGGQWLEQQPGPTTRNRGPTPALQFPRL